jgi:hypothetical protein
VLNDLDDGLASGDADLASYGRDGHENGLRQPCRASAGGAGRASALLRPLGRQAEPILEAALP